LGITDAWNDDWTRTLYTHFTGHGVSRVDRIYLSAALFKLKQSAETLAAAFTDHNEAAIKLRLEGPFPPEVERMDGQDQRLHQHLNMVG
jgi:hypothetical protein